MEFIYKFHWNTNRVLCLQNRTIICHQRLCKVRFKDKHVLFIYELKDYIYDLCELKINNKYCILPELAQFFIHNNMIFNNNLKMILFYNHYTTTHQVGISKGIWVSSYHFFFLSSIDIAWNTFICTQLLHTWEVFQSENKTTP